MQQDETDQTGRVGSTPCCTRSKATGQIRAIGTGAPARTYEAYADAQAELRAIKAALTY